MNRVIQELVLLRPMGKPYYKKVLSYSPTAYWPLWETSGNVAHCLVNSAQNGTYLRDVATMGTQTGIGDGNTAPMFDGVNDAVNIYSATLNGAWNPALGTLMIWCKMPTGPVNEEIIRLRADGNNMISLRAEAATARIIWQYVAGGVSETMLEDTVATTTWQALFLDQSKAGEIVHAYRHVAGTAVTSLSDVNLGVWSGNLDNLRTVIGASTTGPTSSYTGGLAHMALFPWVLGTAERAALCPF